MDKGYSKGRVGGRRSPGIFDDERNRELLHAIKEVFAEKFLERGDMKFLILDEISKKPKHGYEIIVSISGRFGNMYKPSPGSIYPTLQTLDEEGLVRSESAEGKKTYALTKDGAAYLTKNMERLNEISSQFCENLFGMNEDFSKRIDTLIDLWTQMAYEVFLRSKNAMKSGDANLDKRMTGMERVLKRTVKELRGVWDG